MEQPERIEHELDELDGYEGTFALMSSDEGRGDPTLLSCSGDRWECSRFYLSLAEIVETDISDMSAPEGKIDTASDRQIATQIRDGLQALVDKFDRALDLET